MCRRLVCRLYERFGVVCILLFAYRLHIYKVYFFLKIAHSRKVVTNIYKKTTTSFMIVVSNFFYIKQSYLSNACCNAFSKTSIFDSKTFICALASVPAIDSFSNSRL